MADDNTSASQHTPSAAAYEGGHDAVQESDRGGAREGGRDGGRESGRSAGGGGRGPQREPGGFRIRLSDNEMRAVRAVQDAFNLRSPVAVLGFSVRTIAQLLEQGQLDELVAQQRAQAGGRRSEGRGEGGRGEGGRGDGPRGGGGRRPWDEGRPERGGAGGRIDPLARPQKPAPATVTISEAGPEPEAAADSGDAPLSETLEVPAEFDSASAEPEAASAEPEVANAEPELTSDEATSASVDAQVD